MELHPPQVAHTCSSGGYFQGDFKAIGKYTAAPTLDQLSYFIPESKNSDLDAYAPDLWNGNIKEMVTAISKLTYGATGNVFTPMARAFKYDQLNRIAYVKSFNQYDGQTNEWLQGSQPNGLQQYSEDFTYDANGNILSLNRFAVNSTGVATQMDALTYTYTNGKNQLTHVTDGVGSTVFGNDVDDQSTNNYTYDAIGNLTKDIAEGIDQINWTVYGKIQSIVRVSGSTKPSLAFAYSPDGHRVLKKVYNPIADSTKIFIYSRDASGNEMAHYSLLVDGNQLNSNLQSTAADTLWWQSSSIYGSSRVGMKQCNKWMSTSFMSRTVTVTTSFTRGKKRYELSNHLGNVLVVVSDKRSAICTGTMTIARYEAEVITAQDYYAFGSPIKNRTYSSGAYRYGFNGKEKDDETAGEGNVYAFEARIYDARLGKFFSADPWTKKYPFQTPYAYHRNRPTSTIDWKGFGDPPKILYHATNKVTATIIEKSGFNATKFGRYSKYTWFNSVKSTAGTGIKGASETFKLQGINLKDAHKITNSKIVEFYKVAKKELGYTSKQLKASKAKMKRVSALKFKKIGEYMNKLKKPVYQIGSHYAVTDLRVATATSKIRMAKIVSAATVLELPLMIIEYYQINEAIKSNPLYKGLGDAEKYNYQQFGQKTIMDKFFESDAWKIFLKGLSVMGDQR